MSINHKYLFMVGLLASGLVVADSDSNDYDINGFMEARLGTRLESDPNQRDISIGELRLQLELEQELESATLQMVLDVIIDPVLDEYDIDIETGDGWLDLRQFNAQFFPGDNVDLKIGRQILTWGTGDLLFINDLFAKDYKALFIGRDDEYLKAPSDAVKASIFFEAFNADLVYLPSFDADRFIDGRRVSFYDRSQNSFRGKEAPIRVNRPQRWFKDHEFALRLYRTIGNTETALYYNSGFWKSPAGFDPQTGKALFPPLKVYGASLRSPLAGGIVNMEFGYYKSNDNAKRDPFSKNSEFQWLLGYEVDLGHNLTSGVQYKLERKLDYDQYLNSLPATAIRDEENKSTVTLRLTKLLWQQNLRLSLFNFYSPTDKDGYLRVNSLYKMSDELRIEIGTNYFYGDEPYTFYAQFQHNNNIYTSVRRDF